MRWTRFALIPLGLTALVNLACSYTDEAFASPRADWLARIVLGLEQKDVSSGFKAYSRGMVEELTSRKLTSSSFSYQEETLLVAKRAGKRVVEIPFTFTARKAGKTKFKTADILRFLRAILAMRYKAAE